MLSIANLLLPGQHTAPPTRTAKQLLKDTLYETYRVTAIDGRTFIGSFICVDKGLNIILSQAEEFLPDERTAEVPDYWPRSDSPQPGGFGGRQVGMVLIPGKQVDKVEAVVSDEWKQQMDASEQREEASSKSTNEQ